MEAPQNDSVFKRPGNDHRTRFQLDISGKVYALHEGLNTIGRSVTAVVNIKSLNVSHVHAIITVVNDNELYITDMKSANGTELELRKLEPLKLYKLEDNATVRFANICGVFKKNALVRERDGASQTMSQDFYSAPTQPLYEDIRDDIHDMPTQAQNIHEMATQLSVSPGRDRAIHEMPTQLLEAPTQSFETSTPAGELSTQEIEVSELAPPEAFVDASDHDVSTNYFMPSTSMVEEAVASGSGTNADLNKSVEVIRIIVEAKDEVISVSPSEECTQIIVDDRVVETAVLPNDSSEECTQIPLGRVKRKPNPLDSPERSPEPVPDVEAEESQIPARPMPKKPNVFDSGSSRSPDEEKNGEEAEEEVVVKRKSIYALSSDSDTDIEDNDKTVDSSDVIPCTQEYSCLTESFNLQMNETQGQIDKENLSVNVQLDVSNDVIDETVFLKSPEANMDLTCVSEQTKPGESSKRQEVSMELTCTSIKSTQEKKSEAEVREAVPEAIPEENEDDGQTQDYFETGVAQNKSGFLALLCSNAKNKGSGETSVGTEASGEALATSQGQVANTVNLTADAETNDLVQDAEDLYLQPTQCFDQSEPRIVETDELYIQPTQVLKADAAVTNAEKTDSDTENEASNFEAKERKSSEEMFGDEFKATVEDTSVDEEQSNAENKDSATENEASLRNFGGKDRKASFGDKCNGTNTCVDEHCTKENCVIPETQATCYEDFGTENEASLRNLVEKKRKAETFGDESEGTNENTSVEGRSNAVTKAEMKYSDTENEAALQSFEGKNGKAETVGGEAEGKIENTSVKRPSNKEKDEIPETLATSSKDSRTVVVSKPSAEAIEKPDSVEAGIATLFMNDGNETMQSSGESVEDQLQQLFYTQREKETFECTQQLVTALEDSFEGDKNKSGHIRFLSQESMEIASTQSLVATLNKSDVCDDSISDDILGESQLLTVTKEPLAKTYSKGAAGTPGSSSCSSDATVIELPICHIDARLDVAEAIETKSIDVEIPAETYKAIQASFLSQLTQGSSDSADEIEEIKESESQESESQESESKEAESKKPLRVSTRKQSKSVRKIEDSEEEEMREPRRKDQAKSSEKVEELVEEAVEVKPRQSRRGAASKLGSGSEAEASGAKTPVAKAAIAKTPAKTPVSKTSTTETPEAKASVAKASVAKASVAKASVAKASVAKTSEAKASEAETSESEASEPESSVRGTGSTRAASKRKTVSEAFEQGNASKQRAGRKAVRRIIDVSDDESGDGFEAEETAETRHGSSRNQKTVSELKASIYNKLEKALGLAEEKPASRYSSRASAKETEAVTEPKPGSSRRIDESPKRVPAVEKTASRPASRASTRQAEAETEAKASSRQRGRTPKPVLTEEKQPASRQSSRARSKQPEAEIEPQPGSSRQRETTPKPGSIEETKPDSTEENTASRHSSRASSRASSKLPEAEIEPKSSTSKQLDETPKPGRAKRKPPPTAEEEPSPERNTRGSRSKTSDAKTGGKKAGKQKDEEEVEETEETAEEKAEATLKEKGTRSGAKRKTNEEDAKPNKKTRTKLYESSDEFEDDSPPPPPSPKKLVVPVTKTRKRGAAVIAEKVKVSVPKAQELNITVAAAKKMKISEAKESENEPSTSKKAQEEFNGTEDVGGATKTRRLSANSRSIKNAQAKQEAEETKAATSRKRTAKNEVTPEAPPMKKTVPDTAERNKRKTKPKVIFTMMDDPVLESMVRQLGGVVVDSVQTSTVLVTGAVKRSMKLLMAVGQGKPICSPQWLKASKQSSTFLDPWDYILVDKEAEKKWDFSLRESLSRSQNFRLFEDYTFQICVTTAVDVLKGAIEACGGKVVTKGLARCSTKNLVIVGTKDVDKKYAKILKDNQRISVVEPEAIFDGTLRQELRFDRHIIK